MPCVLCGKSVASNEMNYHLVHCASKTNRCPNCSKYICRANYTFHVDNNCIDLDEDNEEESIPCEVCDEQIKFSSYTYHLVLFNRF